MTDFAMTPKERSAEPYSKKEIAAAGRAADRGGRAEMTAYYRMVCENIAAKEGGKVAVLADGSVSMSFPPDETIPAEARGVPVVYFIRCGEFVKIGFASNVKSRIGGIKTSTPYEVELLRAVPGTVEDERAFHARFSAHHHTREWFRLEGALAEWLEVMEA